jgi:hypothetical protein
LALWPLVPLRQRLAQIFIGTAIMFAALISVGITAPEDAAFTIGIRPVFLRVDAAAFSESRARALGLDVDIKVWTLHLHFAWSAIPLDAAESATSTKPPCTLI